MRAWVLKHLTLGEVEAWCLNNPLFDVIIGNRKWVRDRTIICFVRKGFAYICNVQGIILVLDLNWMC